MNTQSVTVTLVGAALLAFVSACERPRDPTPTTPAAPTAPSKTPNVGEGERESTPWTTSVSGGAATATATATATAIDPRVAIEQFQAQVANQPAIAAVSNASLILTVNGDLVLQGTAESDDIKDELENVAEKFAGRDVENEIEVADE